MVNIDLSNIPEGEPYSGHSRGLADYAIRNGKVTRQAGALTAECQSLSGLEIWRPSAALSDGAVVGVSCTCPNGRKGGVRARCWHAAALEELIAADRRMP